jgi:hypothetical protein
MFGGRYENRGGSEVLIAGGKASFVLPNQDKVEGSLDRDGTMGGAYVVRLPEGSVCGTFRISLWAKEGQVGDGSSFQVKWLPPNGSVASTCTFMTGGEGLYAK